jgi:hypothetical protein
MSRWNGRSYRQIKSWKHRVVRQQEAWGKLLEDLTTEYLRWRWPGDRGNILNTSEPRVDPSATIADDAHAVPTQGYAYTVDIFDIFSLSHQVTVHRHADSTSPALDLMRSGYLAKSPTRPTIAVAVSTLELLYRLRQRKPLYSIEAFAKVVCDYYKVK